MTSAIPGLAPGPVTTARVTDGTYGFVNAALTHLVDRPEDDDVRLKAAKAFMRLGIGVAARELLEGAGGAVREHPEFGQLVESIPEGLGRQDWCSLKPRFDNNLRILAPRRQDAESFRARWEEVRGQYELFMDANGVYQVRHRPPGGPAVYLPFLGNHARLAEEAPLPQDIEQLMPGPYLFVGLDLGWYFARVWGRTKDTFLGYSSALYIVEPEPALMAVVLHLHNWRELLADERVMLFMGSDCGARFRRHLASDENLPLPCEVYDLSKHRPMPGADVITVMDTIAGERERRVSERASVLRERYEKRDASYWGRRFAKALEGSGPPLRILAPVSTHTSFLQYSMRDAKEAVERMGHKFRVITESTCYKKVAVGTYHDEILRSDPDLFFVIDHIRPEFGAIVPANLPVMCWDQDALPGVFTPEKVRQMSPLDTVVGLPKYECLAQFGCDPRQFLVTQMPTGPGQFDGSVLTEEQLDAYRCDVSYVSHASQTPQAFHESELAMYKDEGVRRLLKDLYPAAVQAVRSGVLIKGTLQRALLAESEARTGITVVDPTVRNRLIRWYLWRLCDRVFRHQALEWVAEWARARGAVLRVYGNGWDKHPTLAPFAAGPAQNGSELLCIYRASAINLQLMPAGFLHQRALDGLAAGGFFLTRACADDQRDPRFPALWERLCERDLSSAAEVLGCGDEGLISEFRTLGQESGLADEAGLNEMFMTMLVNAQTDHPDEVFPRFTELVFRDEASFAAAADAFLADADERRSFAEQMRRVVIERYSYETAMRRFLTFARDYFVALAHDSGVGLGATVQ
ncbi:MAG: hypothetical protein JSU63_21855 [Phycisphaerales bacterium]|nr:MAG: hypothetical protein JSU63_21855 [Phycisphaerales bacterium]